MTETNRRLAIEVIEPLMFSGEIPIARVLFAREPFDYYVVEFSDDCKNRHMLADQLVVEHFVRVHAVRGVAVEVE